MRAGCRVGGCRGGCGGRVGGAGAITGGASSLTTNLRVLRVPSACRARGHCPRAKELPACGGVRSRDSASAPTCWRTFVCAYGRTFCCQWRTARWPAAGGAGRTPLTHLRARTDWAPRPPRPAPPRPPGAGAGGAPTPPQAPPPGASLSSLNFAGGKGSGREPAGGAAGADMWTSARPCELPSTCARRRAHAAAVPLAVPQQLRYLHRTSRTGSSCVQFVRTSENCGSFLYVGDERSRYGAVSGRAVGSGRREQRGGRHRGRGARRARGGAWCCGQRRQAAAVRGHCGSGRRHTQEAP